ncbi:putative ribonuclease H protein At1g65750 [Raphanus sativus]|uniref:Ribonuclease H protein At1g65750 n=1 Tax=Raphanus sativus TaxID=3726 RepID=A0A6J0NTL5_RAPSA|nr:putative ribonuclease H protein At1g65750 [Raphanus sativus]XP_056842702.1 putative ribonuclease H protein At1g65750 [Raphanus sativus]XP_056842703.1 putative ribonuclease H protein At1g65750 [Raphanus sativus]XP_056842704.1 putative ribonuclease H protein At1g65750 [Raphanus sativus]XP_056842706.1 putative ribonuclease H protein At1g65750 [Raphanus sativus]
MYHCSRIIIMEICSRITIIKKRLSSWSVKSLSFSGRLLLLKTVISGITTFWCSAFILPKACIKRINSLCNVFLWRGNIEDHNTARVAWSTVTLTKDQGGLGLNDLVSWNNACCLKLVWMLFFRAGSIWVAWFTKEVLKGSVHNYWITKPSPSYSWLANKLLKMREVVYPMIKLRMQNGCTARFWTDNWSPFGNLTTFLHNSSSRLGIPMKATVASLHRNGTWRLPPARTDQELQLLTHLTTITLSPEDDYYDWELAGKTTIKYSTGDVYAHLRGEIPQVSWAKVVWSSYGISRQSFLAWLIILNRCPTRDRLISWGLQVPAICLLCNSHPETRDHLFHHCSYTSALWAISAAKLDISSPSDWTGMVSVMVNLPITKSRKAKTLLTLLVWKATLYWLWHERNSRLHTNSFRSIDSLYSGLDRQIRNRISSIRSINPLLSSKMMQLWL